MLGWIKKRCKRRSLPPGVQQLHEEEVTRNIPCFNLDEQEEGLYEDIAFGKSHDEENHCHDSIQAQRTIELRHGTLQQRNGYGITTVKTSESICPLCRSRLRPSLPCECTNVYEEPRTDLCNSVDDYAVPRGWSPRSTSSDFELPTAQKHINVLIVSDGVVSESLDEVYELATCPFTVPNPRHRPRRSASDASSRPVRRSVSDGSSRPLPKVPFNPLPRKRPVSTSGDDSSGYYETIGSDTSSCTYSRGYSDITENSYTGSSEGFQDSFLDDVDYEEFNFQSDLSSSKNRRYSLGSATPNKTSNSLRKRDVTLSHSKELNKVLARDQSRRGQLFRSLRVRSLFKSK